MMVVLSWGAARFGVPQEVLGVQKSTQHHEHHQTDCQWTSTREFDISLERALLSGLAVMEPDAAKQRIGLRSSDACICT